MASPASNLTVMHRAEAFQLSWNADSRGNLSTLIDRSSALLPGSNHREVIEPPERVFV
jgi:hypothetical protein